MALSYFYYPSLFSAKDFFLKWLDLDLVAVKSGIKILRLDFEIFICVWDREVTNTLASDMNSPFKHIIFFLLHFLHTISDFVYIELIEMWAGESKCARGGHPTPTTTPVRNFYVSPYTYFHP